MYFQHIPLPQGCHSKPVFIPVLCHWLGYLRLPGGIPLLVISKDRRGRQRLCQSCHNLRQQLGDYKLMRTVTSTTWTHAAQRRPEPVFDSASCPPLHCGPQSWFLPTLCYPCDLSQPWLQALKGRDCHISLSVLHRICPMLVTHICWIKLNCHIQSHLWDDCTSALTMLSGPKMWLIFGLERPSETYKRVDHTHSYLCNIFHLKWHFSSATDSKMAS